MTTHRCRFLARCYTPAKKFAEALTLTQHGSIHLREARSILSLLADSDPVATGDPAFYPLTLDNVSELEDELSKDSLQCKKDWFAFNGGAADNEGGTSTAKAHKKPLFFDIALNYVQLDMERLQERAGRQPAPASQPATIAAPIPKQPQTETSTLQGERKTVASRAKVEEVDSRPQTPEPSAPARGGLSSLLGGWWGRK